MSNGATERANGGVPHAEFRDIDEFNGAIKGWDLDFRQIERGGLIAGLAYYPSCAASLLTVDFSRAVLQSGSPPRGMRTFGVRLDDGPRVESCGQEFGLDSLYCFHPSRGFECLAPGRFAGLTLSFADAHLVAVAEQLGHSDLLDKLPLEGAIDVSDANGLRRLRTVLRQRFATPGTGRPRVVPAGSLDRFEHGVLEDLIMLLVESRYERRRASLHTRSRALKAAMSCILEHARDPVTVAQLCEASGVSWRTLDRAFRERLGVSPKACINAVRLQGARRALKEAEPIASVTDIANSWGFWHIGDFALNYRREFNELPSETLRNRERRDFPQTDVQPAGFSPDSS